MIDFSKIPENYNPTSFPVMEAYDALWGFIIIKQDISFEYEESQYSYDSPTTVTINGTFTVNAELNSIVTPNSAQDESRFNAMKNKYDTLRDLFINASKQLAPSSILEYGTVSDLRCIKLPDIFRDKDNYNIYMRPFSLNISDTQWPTQISYTAVLKEIQKPACKISVSGYIINDAVIDIVARRPRISTEKYFNANSGEIYFAGWEPRKYKVSGDLSGIIPSGCIFHDSALGLANSLMSGMVSIDKIISNGNFVRVISDLFVDSSDFSAVKSGTGISVNIEGKE
ncbi:MAG: hypothetical protein M0P71_01370 [Melioribacteraceae bacterium]|nr:hypothetical protein [Melioribacteraceae bacterium]